MEKLCVSAVLLLCGTFLSAAGQQEEFRISDWIKTLNNIKDEIRRLHTYYTYFKDLKFALDLVLGSDQTCQFTCPDDGEKPIPRPGHNPTSNGCGTPLLGFHFDIGIPAITKCCNQHDRCYDTCGRQKLDCDEQFQVCLKTICGNLLNVLGLDQRVQACESGIAMVFNAIMHLSCKPYLESQKAACVCRRKYKTDL